MTKHDDGGPAYPRRPYVGKDAYDANVPDESFTGGHEGMSLHDYYAGQATEYEIQHYADALYRLDHSVDVTPAMARGAFASAMIKEKRKREKEQQDE